MTSHPTPKPTTPRTEHVSVPGGSLAYELSGTSSTTGPVVVMVHGMGDDRRAFRFLAPLLVAAGYRVAAVDLRGAGESSTGWASYTRTDIAGDLVAVVEHLGENLAGPVVPVVLVGHSIAGGAATIAAATAPHLFAAVVELAPFTRKQSVALGDLRNAAFRRATTHLMATALLGSARAWQKYLDVAYPGTKPGDWQERSAQVAAMLAEPARMKALRSMFASAPTDAGAHLGNVRRPVLVVQGGADPDWASPRAEGEAILAALPVGIGRLEIVPGSGHYPHVQHPDEVARLILDFLAATTGAAAGEGTLDA